MPGVKGQRSNVWTSEEDAAIKLLCENYGADYSDYWMDFPELGARNRDTVMRRASRLGLVSLAMRRKTRPEPKPVVAFRFEDDPRAARDHGSHGRLGLPEPMYSGAGCAISNLIVTGEGW